MKKLIATILLCMMYTNSVYAITVGNQSIDLEALSLKELEQLQQEIKKEISKNHTPSSSDEAGVLNVTKEYVEKYYKDKGIDVSWPWFDYEYTQAWEHFTLDTRVDYKLDKKSQSDSVFAEVDRVEGKYILTYLKLGNDVILDEKTSMTANIETEASQEPAMMTESKSNADPIIEATSVPASEPTPTLCPTEAPTPEPISTPEPPMVRIKDKGNVNIRSKPSSESQKVGTGKPNEKYVVIGEEKGWYQIVLEDGTTGWVSGKMCTLLSDNIAKSTSKSQENDSQPYVVTIDEFNKRFNKAGETFTLKHKLSDKKYTVSKGIMDSWQAAWKEQSMFIQLAVYPGTRNAREVMACYVQDGQESSATQFLIMCVEMMIGTGIIETSDEAASVFDRLGFLNGDMKDGNENSIIINGKKLSFFYSTITGVMLYVSPLD